MNRQELMEGFIQSLRLQTFKDFETIVVDQSEPPLKLSIPDGIRIHVLHRSPGLSAARNQGILASTGD